MAIEKLSLCKLTLKMELDWIGLDLGRMSSNIKAFEIR